MPLPLSLRRGTAAFAIAGALVAPSVSLAQAGAKTPDPAEKVVTPQLDFSGLFFGSLSYRTDSATKAANGGKERSQFNIDRVYLNFRLPAGEDANVRVTTDVFQQSPSGYYAGWTVRLKYAYLQYKFLHDIGGMKGFNAVARIGMLHTVSVDHYEQFWPRYMEQTAIERNGFFSSSDVGVAALVTLPGKLGEVYATVTNGAGYTSGETDRFKDVGLRVTLTPFGAGEGMFKTFTISPWLYFGKSASTHQNDVASATNLGAVSDGLTKNRFGILIGNRDRRLTFSLDYDRRSDGYESGLNTVASPLATADTSGTVTSVYVSVRPFELADAKTKSPFGVFFRYDHFVPRDNSVAGVNAATPGHQRTFGGVFWEPNSRSTLALDYQGLKFSNYTPATLPAEQSAVFVHWTVSF